MSAFIRRFTELPSLQALLAIEAVNIIDIAPQGAFLGVGSGTLLAVGEYEDGPFTTGSDASDYANPGQLPGQPGTGNILEVFSDADFKRKYGQFGFVYGGTPSQNPCGRRHLSEDWNGNGFLKLKNVRAQRLLCGRVDTSVGSVAFLPRAVIAGSIPGPFALAAGNQLSVTTDIGGPALSTALAAVVATEAGIVFVASGFVGGEQITIAIDGGPAIVVTFTALDQTPAQVAARINATLGYTAATSGGGLVTIVGLTPGTDGSVILADITPGALVAIGHVAGTTAGTGNVGNINAVTATELATIINATPALNAIDAVGRATSDGRLTISSDTSTVGDVLVTAGAIATATGLTTGTTVLAGEHAAGRIPAGTRVSNGVTTWVTMQTLSIAAGTSTAPNQNAHVVKVRPALDDGTALGAAATTVNVVTDMPTFTEFDVTNPAALSVALTQAQMDAAYLAAFDKTLSLTSPARAANFSISARRSVLVVTRGRANAISASDNGCYGRKFITGAPLGFTLDQALADVASYRSDRLYYTYVGLKTRLEEIAVVGADGGIGFTDGGIVTLRADSALATLCCMLPPEENPGQQTQLLLPWFALEDVASDFGLSEYTELKRAGIVAPRIDSLSGLFFQSGVTSSVEPGRTEIERRNMADFVQDSLAILALPYAKKLPTQRNKDGFSNDVEAFMDSLQSPDAPDKARIRWYRVDLAAGNTPELEDQGVFTALVACKTFSSIKAFVIPVEIGSTVTITDAA